MRWLATLTFVLAACNRVLGVMATTEVDARQFDVAIDAPFSCPAFGAPLQFSTLIHQVIAQPCSTYSISADASIAIAICGNSDSSRTIYEGPTDQPLVPAVGSPGSLTVGLSNAWISPEGDLMTLDVGNDPQLYRVGADGSVTYAGELPIGTAVLGTLSRGPVRHAMATDGSPTVTEWTYDGTTWTQLAMTFGNASNNVEAWLSPDGLHLVTTDDQHLHQYADRAAIDAPFTARNAVSSLPTVDDVFITQDCSRAYFSAVGTIFYAQQ